MRKYNYLLAGVIVAYFVAACLLWQISVQQQERCDMGYKAEVNDLLFKAQEGVPIEELLDTSCVYIKAVHFLPVAGLQDDGKQQAFFANRNQLHTVIKPLYIQQKCEGYLCFDYRIPVQKQLFWVDEMTLLLTFLLVMGILVYVRNKLLMPFAKFQEMPYELAKGHLREEIPESRNRYFGRFLWGISMLRDTLQSTRKRELELAREKKTMILSISHDIKIPLSAIKLYARSLYEGLAENEQDRKECGHRIEEHADEIEGFVKKIMETSREEVVSVEVQNGEFYMKDYVNRIAELYQDKCATRMVDFQIESYVNHLLKGDLERAIEVMENLMENALKYGDGRRITISFHEEDGCQVIDVFNTGEVIQRQEIPHLFDSFFRGSNAKGKEGNGLGLYICKQIMQKMGGEVYVQTRAEGMNFCLVFMQ